MQLTHSIALDFGRDTLPITIFAKQYDKESRFVEIVPLDRGKEYELESGVTARLQLTKPDGHTVLNTATVTDGIIKVELTEQTLTTAGTAIAEIGLYKGDALLSSQNFCIEIKKAAYNLDSPTSSDEYNALIDALGKIEPSVEAVTVAATAANTALNAATAATENANIAATAANEAAENADSAAIAATAAATAANEAAELAAAAQGPKGDPGIVISATEPTSEDHPVWINPDGDDTPDNPLGITGAGVGQLAKIAAVDADGKPTAWAADDIPSGGGTKTWELAADITTAEEVSVIEITEGLSAYSKLWVDLSTVVSVASNLFVNANGADSSAYSLLTSGYAGAGKRIMRGMIEKLPNGLIGGYGAVYRDTTGADSPVYTLYDTIAQTQCFISAVSHAKAQFPVNKLRISTTGGATFKTGTLVKVWGCKE